MTQYEINLIQKKLELQNDGHDMTMNQIFSYCKSQLSSEHQARPWEYINHGVGLLNSDEELNAYISAYSEMHIAKCEAAFQKLDLGELTTPFEIIDWGCGQGIGTLVLLDILNDAERSQDVRRHKINFLKKITLIEPSASALARATSNLQILYPSISLNPINKYLPGDGNHDEIQSIENHYHTIIHIFSNILDIQTVNIHSLARLISTIGGKQIIMCTSPMNSGAFRLHEFANQFVGAKSFVKIDNPIFSTTKSTHHILSCCADCFVYEGDEIQRGEGTINVPYIVDGKPVNDDYDDNMLLANHILSVSEFKLYKKLNEGLADDDSMFVKPVVGGDTPLFVVVRPNKGVLIITKHTKNMSCSSSIEKNTGYQRNLILLHVKDMVYRTLTDSKHWSIVQKAIYLEDMTENEFRKQLGEECHVTNNDDQTSREKQILKDSKYTFFISDHLLQKSGVEIIHHLRMDIDHDLFKPMVRNNFITALSSNWHSYKEGVEITPSSEQAKLMVSKGNTQQKINGVAGSGKTQILAERAIDAMLRTNQKVLVLSYNITLTNYLEMRLSKVRKNFSWELIDISNYHQFFNTQSRNIGKNVRSLDAYQDENYFADAEVQKYAAIFIDEVQDYKTEWLKIIVDNFLLPNGEFVVFGDSKQNVYNRTLDVNGDVNLGIIRGVWNNSLTKSYRFQNNTLNKLANDFLYKFYEEETVIPIEQQPEMVFEECYKSLTVSKDSSAEELYKVCEDIMGKYASEHPDEDTRTTFAILSQTVDVLRDIDTLYRKDHGKNKTMTTFESQEQYDKLEETSKYLNNDLEDVRASKKRHFKCGSKLIKISTIQSFKGWEAENLILILQPEAKKGDGLKYYISKKNDTREIIYTGITRAKSKLYIINMENQQFGEFFENWH